MTQQSPALERSVKIPPMPEQVVTPLRSRILCTGADLVLLQTRQLLLSSRGYDPTIAIPGDVDRELLTDAFDLVIISASVEQVERNRILAIMAAKTRALVLDSLVMPDELLCMVKEALVGSISPRQGI